MVSQSNKMYISGSIFLAIKVNDVGSTIKLLLCLGIQICSERKTEAGMVPDERGGVSPLGGKKTVTPTSYQAPGHAGLLPVQSLLHQHHGHTIPGKMTVS